MNPTSLVPLHGSRNGGSGDRADLDGQHPTLDFHSPPHRCWWLGLRRLTKEICDQAVAIPLTGTRELKRSVQLESLSYEAFDSARKKL